MANEQANVDLILTAHDGVSGPIGRIGDAFRGLGNEIGGEFGSVLNTIGDGFANIDRSSSGLASKMTVIGAAAAGLGIALLTLASKEQQAQAQLQTAIEDTGHSWEEYAAQIEAAIKTGENFGQNAVDTENALATLTQATSDPTVALTLLSAAFDLAAAKHESLRAAASQIGRAMSGNSRLLRTYGIQVKLTGTESEKAAQLVDAFVKKFGGQAQSAVSGFIGQLTVLSAKFTDIAGVIAGPLGTTLTFLGTGLSLVGSALQVYYARAAHKAAQASTEAAVANTTLGETALATSAAVDTETASLLGLAGANEKVALTGAASSTAGAGGALRTAGAAKTAGKVAGAVGGAFVLSDIAGAVNNATRSGPDNLGRWDAATTSVKELTTSKQALDDAFSTANVNQFGSVTDKVSQGIQSFRATINQTQSPVDAATASMSAYVTSIDDLIGSGNLPEAAKQWKNLVAVGKDHGATVQDLTTLYPEFTAALDNAGISLDQLTGSLAKATPSDSLGPINSQFVSTTDAAGKNLAILTDRASGLGPAFTNVAGASKAWLDVQHSLTDANDRLIAQVSGPLDNATGRYDVTLRAVIPTLGQYTDMVLGQISAEHKAQDARTQAIADIKKYDKAHKVSTAEVHALYDEIVGAAQAAADKQVTAAGKAKVFRDTLFDLGKKVKKGSTLDKELQDLLTRLDAFDKTIHTKLVVDFLATTRDAHGHLQTTWYSPTNLPKPPGSPGTGPSTGHGAIGGPLTAGRPYWVGEFGKELYVPDHSGTLYPDSALHPVGGGPASVTYNIYPRTTDPTEVVRLIQTFDRRNTPAWRAA